MGWFLSFYAEDIREILRAIVAGILLYLVEHIFHTIF